MWASDKDSSVCGRCETKVTSCSYLGNNSIRSDIGKVERFTKMCSWIMQSLYDTAGQRHCVLATEPADHGTNTHSSLWCHRWDGQIRHQTQNTDSLEVKHPWTAVSDKWWCKSHTHSGHHHWLKGKCRSSWKELIIHPNSHHVSVMADDTPSHWTGQEWAGL